MLFTLLLSVHARASGGSPFTESVVIFNTICAKCHEAECSGRLSFDEAFEASRNHIIRHYGGVAEKLWLQKELFVILNHMKEKCAYYPMDVVVPPQRVWSSRLLEEMATLLDKNYFIPLGSFFPGKYNLNLQLERDVKVTVHMVSESFDMVMEDCFQAQNGEINIAFEINDSSNYYLRIYPRSPINIKQLMITGAPD